MGIFKGKGIEPQEDLAPTVEAEEPCLYGLEGGELEGEICNRLGCTGVIRENPGEGSCSCHLHPPCGYCVNMPFICDTCDWDSNSEQAWHDKHMFKEIKDSGSNIWREMLKEQDQRKVDFNRNFRNPQYVAKEIEWMVKEVGHAQMIKHGMMPEGTPIEDVIKEVKGTFGGKFTKFSKTRFEYIAYTD